MKAVDVLVLGFLSTMMLVMALLSVIDHQQGWGMMFAFMSFFAAGLGIVRCLID